MASHHHHHSNEDESHEVLRARNVHELNLTGPRLDHQHKQFMLTSTFGWAIPGAQDGCINTPNNDQPPELTHVITQNFQTLNIHTVENNKLVKIVEDNNNAVYDAAKAIEEGSKIVEEARKELHTMFEKVKSFNHYPPPSPEDPSGVLSLHSSVLAVPEKDKVIVAFSQVFHKSKRATDKKDSEWGSVLSAMHVATNPKYYYDEARNVTQEWTGLPWPLDVKSLNQPGGIFGDLPTNQMFKMALGMGAWELVYMYQRSLLGPSIQTYLQTIPLSVFLKPLPMINLPQKDLFQTSERHRILEITQIQYNYTGLIQFGGYFGEPLAGGPAKFFHVPPSNNLFLISDADSVQVQLGYNISFIRNAVVSKLASALGGFYTKSSFTSLQDYVNAMKFFNVDVPIVTNNINDLNNWLNDIEFGRQRLQGLNPEMIAKVTLDNWKNYILPKLNWNIQIDKRVFELLGSKMRITDAIEKGIVYYVDYSCMDNPTLRDFAMGFNRYIAAPIALFFYNESTNNLMPLGIQLLPNQPNVPNENQYQFHLPSKDDKGQDTPAWILAKIWVNSLDGQYQEIVSHLMETHQVSELFCVGFFRNLAANHPVNLLVRSHFEATLEVNSIAYGDLLSYDGAINQTIGAGAVGGALVISKLWPTWNFYQRSFKQNLVNRGLLNPDGSFPDNMKGYYWREDGLRLWNIIYTFVQQVLDSYYLSDADIVNDWELQNWLNELQSAKGGQLKGPTANGKMTTKVDLYTMLANLIFTVSAKHSAGNSGQFDYYGFTPNVPGALYIPPRINERNTTWATIFQALPPKQPALNQMSITWLLSNIVQNNIPMLGNAIYPNDGNWNKPVATFRQNLAKLSSDIQEREKGKPYPYLYLDPAKIGNSIYI